MAGDQNHTFASTKGHFLCKNAEGSVSSSMLLWHGEQEVGVPEAETAAFVTLTMIYSTAGSEASPRGLILFLSKDGSGLSDLVRCTFGEKFPTAEY